MSFGTRKDTAIEGRREEADAGEDLAIGSRREEAVAG
jgi:hypothetical protein